MTLSKEASEIRSEVQALRKGPGRKYTKALRERVLSWIKRAVEDGMRMECDWQEALGIPLPRLSSWRDEERRIAATVVPAPVIPRGTESTALVPISIRDEMPFGPMISFAVPGGYRIEGLTLEQAIGLLRLFG